MRQFESPTQITPESIICSAYRRLLPCETCCVMYLSLTFALTIVGSVDDAAKITFNSLKRQLFFGESEGEGIEKGVRAHERGTDNNELELINGRTSGCIYTHVIVSKICIIDYASRVVRSVIINRLL